MTEAASCRNILQCEKKAIYFPTEIIPIDSLEKIMGLVPINQICDNLINQFEKVQKAFSKNDGQKASHCKA
ncbi:hypothetical protein COT12_00340 [Candidatus Berkelbacteria bacterium CG08_land_8_20_14_0_20_39_8]|uniref:Uncharacterized protein n=1 Tax=Candidatus Berkelbacteria bacterium CG08_land_8_20_14_0_20_39_8 TaxID=1974511 RepID=A0A2M6YD13_9BACT|nr:MAG: hypothetical protein COT12_00340 [Candidatus Berkelbacteria bacterium CG08_land_8_20_14_0_20_39_8]